MEIDGCFLKVPVKSLFLLAIKQNANNQIYLIAWDVVHEKNTKKIGWGQQTKVCLHFGDDTNFVLILDWQKYSIHHVDVLGIFRDIFFIKLTGMLNVIQQEYPNIEHRMCVRHLVMEIQNQNMERRQKWNR